MSLPCKILASFLLIFNFSAKGAVAENIIVVWGALDQDVNLNIPNFQMSDNIEDIRWDREPNKTKVAQFKTSKGTYQLNKTYELLANGTLKIKHLERNYNNNYKVSIYNKEGRNVLEKTFDLRIQEMVSKPSISWNCVNTTLTCKVVKGTDLELNLYQSGKHIGKGHQKVITKKWTSNLKMTFKCTASNNVSEEFSVVTINCSAKGLDVYLITGVSGGGILLMVFVVLLIFYISKRKKQNSRRNDEELEIRAHRVTTEERGRKPHECPASTPQNAAASQPPPPPGHRSQAPGHRSQPPGHRSQAPGHHPLPPGHRVQHQQRKRPPPPSGTQVHQQKGPPLPRPRVQPKPPQETLENSSFN
ncbi:T-cell surface antigen CD2 [Cynocephalus volans]|uniref:T-cell surface antigen CD2 n=1 Tax=Cynocephalus volans TaxID=110931 RepID=UPI002FCCA26F